MVDKVPSTRVCKAGCVMLTAAANDSGSSGPLPPSHLECVWREYERVVHSMVLRNLERLPLGHLCARLGRAKVAIQRSPGRVRGELKRDDTLVEDLVQDVATAMVKAVRAGRLYAARPAIYVWLETTTERVVRDRSRQAAMIGLAGVLMSESPQNDHDGDAEPPSIDTLVFSSGEAADEALDRKRHEVVFLRGLSKAQRPVVVACARGERYEDIASALRVSVGAIRLRLFQARKRWRRGR